MKRALAILIAASLLVAAAAAVPGATASPASLAPRSSRLEIAPNVFGRRYCELFLITKTPGGFLAHVYNTFGLNDCPPPAWQAIDPAAVATANHALAVVRNGPRFWLMNEIEKVQQGPKVIKDLGGLRMIEQATLPLARLDPAPYIRHTVNRATTWIYDKGQTVYELTAPDHSVWVMQSWSQQVDATLRHADLAGLRSKLRLPAGWRYHVHRLLRPLRVMTVRIAAQVLQDNLDDSYSRIG